MKQAFCYLVACLLSASPRPPLSTVERNQSHNHQHQQPGFFFVQAPELVSGIMTNVPPAAVARSLARRVVFFLDVDKLACSKHSFYPSRFDLLSPIIKYPCSPITSRVVVHAGLAVFFGVPHIVFHVGGSKRGPRVDISAKIRMGTYIIDLSFVVLSFSLSAFHLSTHYPTSSHPIHLLHFTFSDNLHGTIDFQRSPSCRNSAVPALFVLCGHPAVEQKCVQLATIFVAIH